MSKSKPARFKSFGDTTDPRGFYRLLVEHTEWLRMRNYSEATIKKRITYVRQFAQWCHDRDLSYPTHITKPILESYQRHLFRYRKANGQPLSWGSQHLALKEIRSYFAWLAKLNHIAFSPAAELDLPRQPKTLPKAILTVDEVEQVLAQPDVTTPIGLRDRAILETFYSTGIRRFELCSLRLDEIQVERRALFIDQGKGKKDRYIPIGTRALLWIARYVDGVRDQFATPASDNTLFLTIHGTPIEADTLTEYGRRYIQAAGIDKPGACHVYRHSMATAMHENGADLTLIQQILGHAKSDTTQIYARTSIRKLLDIHDKTHPAEQEEK
ncbi:site-specific tyrosine recombinase XerC [Stieleria varia]|uniref:Tyrosine recombinase XerC n=1 Tax=Stieleria varia TaxID=2528005 RepID=A0A5C6ASC2_9BACT|nr:site-specific tyrosine recombinase XerC [Stieleria varia]TWU02317.1 Tyrosine recombinase XerC [Stieleria varia]